MHGAAVRQRGQQARAQPERGMGRKLRRGHEGRCYHAPSDVSTGPTSLAATGDVGSRDDDRIDRRSTGALVDPEYSRPLVVTAWQAQADAAEDPTLPPVTPEAVFERLPGE